MVGGVYKIQGKDGDCYIGSTKNFTLRLAGHKSNCYNLKCKSYNNKIYKYLRENNITIKLIPLEECDPNLPTEELRKREQYYYELLKPTLNDQVAYATKEHIVAQRLAIDVKSRIRNKDRNKELNSLWRENNKEHVKDYQTEYDNNRKEQKAERYRQKICGQVLNKIISQIELSLDD